MLRETGLLRSVLVTALVLAHVHAAPANLALFLPEVSLFCFLLFLGRSAAAVPAVFFAVETGLMAMPKRESKCLCTFYCERSVSKKQNINALYATVYLMCARAHCVTACGSTRCAREQTEEDPLGRGGTL